MRNKGYIEYTEGSSDFAILEDDPEKVLQIAD